MFWLGAAVLAVGGYSVWVEPRWIEVTRHEVQLAGLSEALDGTKFVQISDLHRSDTVPDSVIEKTVRIVNSEKPDIVVLTGDFVNHPAENAGPCAEMLSKLKARLGIFAVLGNHDHWTDAETVANALRSAGIVVLDNENREVAPGLFLIGIDDEWAGRPDPELAWSGVDESAGQVLLSHSPLAVDLVSDRRCLMLTGHTHGGQVTIPFISRSRLPGLKGWKYIDGWYTHNDVKMYVNRGIGMIRPAVRFRCRPEVAVFTLVVPAE